MRKRILAAVLAVLLLLVLFPTTTFAALDPSKIDSKYVILIEEKTGTVLFEKASTEQAFPASTTKIMTCLIALESDLKMDDVLTVGKEVRAFTSANSLMKIKEGEKLTFKDLLYGMMLPSGNDAAATIAIRLGGSLEGFAALMNKKAKDLGMNNTHFVTPHGIHDAEHYTTAADMAKLVQAALKNETLMKIVSTKTYTAPPTNKRKTPLVLETTNKFISGREEDKEYANKYVTGMKTGHTKAAQACLVTTAEKNGVSLICVLLYDASNDKAGRWKETQILLDYGFANFKTIPVSELGLISSVEELVDKANAKDENGGLLKLDYILGDATISGTADEINAIKADISKIEIVPLLDNPLVAPIAKGTVVGNAAVKYNGETIAMIKLAASRDVSSVSEHVPKPTNELITDLTKPSEKGPNILLIIIFVLLLLLAALFILKIITSKRLRKKQSMRKANPRKNYYNYRSNRTRY